MKTFYFFMAVVGFLTSTSLSIIFYLSGDMDACCGWGVASLCSIGIVLQRYKEVA